MNTSLLAWAQIIGSGFFGGVVSLILSPIVARQQIRQLEITYRQKLNDNFLQNTRQYIDTLYIPINKSLSKLEDSYKTYKRRKAHLESMMRGKVKILPSLSKKETKAKVQSIIPAWSDLTEVALEDLNRSCSDFRSLMEEITEGGQDSYLTGAFDERLRSFTQFLKAVGEDGCLIACTATSIERNLRIDKKDFGKRFLADIRYLKSYIKDVTLGTTEGYNYIGNKSNYLKQMVIDTKNRN